MQEDKEKFYFFSKNFFENFVYWYEVEIGSQYLPLGVAHGGLCPL